MNFKAFAPAQYTHLVGTSAVQILSEASGSSLTAYRIVNLQPSQQRFSWITAAPGVTPTMAAPSAPVAGTPAVNTILMEPNSVEVFTFPPSVWMIAAVDGAFEVTPGEGA